MSQRLRRRFLHEMAAAGVAVSAEQLFGGLVRAQTAPAQASRPERLYLETRRTLATLDRNVFGSFLEHRGRAIYVGSYDPGAALSDSTGDGEDVVEESRKLNGSIVR